MGVQCQAPYPDKYYKANAFYQAWPAAARQPRQDTLLLLFALSSQVEHGPCKDPKPSAWDSTTHSKWYAWVGLQNMPGNEAMRLFVKTLEEDEPEWYSWSVDEIPAEDTSVPAGGPGLRSMPSDDCWRAPWVVAEKHPHPRFEHSCCLIGSSMYVFGGNAAGGRYLPDVWQLNLETLAWSNMTTAFDPTDLAAESNGDTATAPSNTPSAPFPASAAGVAIPHRGRALLIGGHSKAQKADPASELTVRMLDPARHTWGVLPCTGEVPPARGGHAAALIGDKVYVFGGEGPRLRLQSGVSVLDLMVNEWSTLPWPADVRNAPEARSSLVATSYQDRYLLLFGGGAVGKCHNDLWVRLLCLVLDTDTGTWEQPVVSGAKPSARAGCCSALLGNRWYVLGGGNNAAGCPDMWVLDLVRLGVEALEWKQVSKFDVRASLSSEGASLVAAPAYGALVAFGGYNGVFHNTVSVFKPAEQTEEPSNGSWSAPRNTEIQLADREAQPQESVEQDVAIQERGASIDATPVPDAPAGKNVAAMLEEVSIAKEALSQELDTAQNALAAAEERVQKAQTELAAEKDRALKLEVELSDMQTKLQGMQELELECRKYKQMLAERERKGSGIWGYVTGA